MRVPRLDRLDVFLPPLLHLARHRHRPVHLRELDAGGTRLVLAGRNLAGGAAHEYSCRFEDKADADGDGDSWQRVQATYGDYRNGDLTCVSPAAAAGATTTAEVGLQASSNSQQWDDASLGYAFYAHPTIERIEPAAGPINGSTLIRVFGTHLHGGRKGERRCRIGDDGVAVMASFDASHGALLCRTPHVDVAGSEPLQIALNEEGGLGCEESAAGCSAHYATVGPHFSYFEPPQPELATPASGFSNGTEVVVSGVVNLGGAVLEAVVPELFVLERVVIRRVRFIGGGFVSVGARRAARGAPAGASRRSACGRAGPTSRAASRRS